MVFEARDLRSAKRLSVRADATGSRLVGVVVFTVKGSVDVRECVAAVVVVPGASMRMPMGLIEVSRGAPGTLLRTDDRISVHGPCHGPAESDGLLQVIGKNVVVVIVSTPCVAPELVELTVCERVAPSVLLDRVEDGDAVDRDGDRSDVWKWRGFRPRAWCSRNAKRVVASIRMRNGDLPIPCGDAHHHRVLGHAVRFDVDVLIVPGHRDIVEVAEALGLRRRGPCA